MSIVLVLLFWLVLVLHWLLWFRGLRSGWLGGFSVYLVSFIWLVGFKVILVCCWWWLVGFCGWWFWRSLLLVLV